MYLAKGLTRAFFLDDLKCSRCFHALAPSNVSLVSPVPPHRAQSEMRVDALFGQVAVHAVHAGDAGAAGHTLGPSFET